MEYKERKEVIEEYKERKEVIEEYKDLYNESLEKLKVEISKIFPNAKFDAAVYSGLGSPTLSTSFYLISDKKDQSHQIVDNDPVVTKFIAHLPETHPTKDTKFKLELLQGGLYIEPQEKYLAMSRVRIPHRKSTGNIDKQCENIVKYFKKVGQTIIENKDNLYKKDLDKKYLTINI